MRSQIDHKLCNLGEGRGRELPNRLVGIDRDEERLRFRPVRSRDEPAF